MKAIQTFDQPTTLNLKLDGVTKITYCINSLVFNESCSIMIMFLREGGDRDDHVYFHFTIKGEEYQRWQSDDYIISYLQNKIASMIGP